MRHVFLINPAAGKYDRTGEFTQTIRAACEGLDYEILVSRAPGDCTHIAQAAASSGEPVRLYACGGDGTLNEVVNGAAGHANAAVTHFPGGSGNDFIKIFSDPAAFRSLPRLLDAEEATFDLIRCNGQNYAVNICSMGFDARIGTEIGRYKRLPLVSGTGAYLLSTGVNFIRGIHEHYVVDVDGQHFDGNQTLMCIANGRYYGGSFNPVPDAEPDDGLLSAIRDRQLDTDPLYIVFTSGSTGVPKGVVACHRSVIDYIEQLSATLGFSEETVFGNQTPLYFDACLKELYPTLKFGATTYLIPKSLFMFPIKLVDYLNEHKINTVCWEMAADPRKITGLTDTTSDTPSSWAITAGASWLPTSQPNTSPTGMPTQLRRRACCRSMALICLPVVPMVFSRP